MKTLHQKCQICFSQKTIYSKYIGICPECIRKYPDKSIELSIISMNNARNIWKLPLEIPRDESGRKCNICANKCSIKLGGIGYCGIWTNIEGQLRIVAGKNQALLHTYLDPLPTNCCSSYFCPAGTSAGYPHISYKAEAEYGYYNLACFLYGCNFFCLGCQNDQHRNLNTAEKYTFEKFSNKINDNKRISCICWFGGSPEPQLPWALRASKKAITEFENRIIRVCWEWNGAGNPKLVQNAVKLSLDTGGNAKFDLKYFNQTLSRLLSGVSNKQSFKNFKVCFDKFYNKREEPVLTATTLLIPGYIDSVEVGQIAKFLGELDENIPYSLLVFHPDSFLSDLPITSKNQVNKCFLIAKKHLKNVHIGNKHLLAFT
ncbi:MAG: radical SAM protein [Candidatus Hodarchaeota archaeon]